MPDPLLDPNMRPWVGLCQSGIPGEVSRLVNPAKNRSDGVGVDWSSPGLHHSMKKCNAGELHGSTHVQIIECGNDTGSDCRKA